MGGLAARFLWPRDRYVPVCSLSALRSLPPTSPALLGVTGAELHGLQAQLVPAGFGTGGPGGRLEGGREKLGCSSPARLLCHGSRFAGRPSSCRLTPVRSLCPRSLEVGWLPAGTNFSLASQSLLASHRRNQFPIFIFLRFQFWEMLPFS